MTLPKDYNNQLQEIQTNFFLVLERFKTTFINQAATGSDEAKQLYLSSKAQLTNIYKDLFLLESQIDSSIGNKNTSLEKQDANIKKLGMKYNVDTKTLTTLQDNNLASFPLKRDFARARLHSYIDLVYFIFGIIILIFLIWLGIKKPPPSPLAKLPKLLPIRDKKPIISDNTAKILSLFLGTIIGIVGGYYIK